MSVAFIPPTFQVCPEPVVNAVVPVVVSFAPMVAAPEPNPTPAAGEMVTCDESVNAVIIAPAAIPGPEIAQPTIDDANRADDVTVVPPFVVVTEPSDCCA